MTASLLASNRIQANLAGLTGPPRSQPTAAAPTVTEGLARVIRGESGELDHLIFGGGGASALLSSATPAMNQPGPNGGAGHPDITGQLIAHPLETAPLISYNTPPTAEPGPPEDRIGQARTQAEQWLGRAQESIKGLFE